VSLKTNIHYRLDLGVSTFTITHFSFPAVLNWQILGVRSGNS